MRFLLPSACRWFYIKCPIPRKVPKVAGRYCSHRIAFGLMIIAASWEIGLNPSETRAEYRYLGRLVIG